MEEDPEKDGSPSTGHFARLDNIGSMRDAIWLPITRVLGST